MCESKSEGMRYKATLEGIRNRQQRQDLFEGTRDPRWDPEMAALIKGILDFEDLPHEPVLDFDLLMWHSKGHANPNKLCGFYVFPGDPLQAIVTNFYEAVNFIQEGGFSRC